MIPPILSPFGGLLFLIGVTAVTLLSGYWLVALSAINTLAERLALAALAGLATLVLMVVGVNFFHPLSGVSLGVCVFPAAGALLWTRARNLLLADGRSLVRSPSGRMGLGLAAVFLLLLLSPILTNRQALFYDGTSNHDSFISITAGQSLQYRTYLEAPKRSTTQPWMNMAEDNAGWHPRRAQLGAETLLALFSGLAGTVPLHTCLYFAAALYLPWLAAVYLAITTFYRERISRKTLAALVILQPVFIFFHANSNLPNLLGAMLGAAVIIATEQTLRADSRQRRVSWAALLILGVHGLIAVYPEMIPFTLLPCSLLWLRPWFLRRWDVIRSNTVWVIIAFVAGSTINPAVTLRAWHGFRYSFATARADVIFANLFESLNAAQHVPGFATLSVPTALGLGTVGGAAMSLVLLAAAATGWWRARDRLGALFTLSGSGALLTYTVLTGFNYGWQKSIQFSAVFFVALVTAPLLEAQFENWRQSGWRRPIGGIGLACLLGFFATASFVSFTQIWNWSRQKMLSRDWYELYQLSATTLREQPVLVESASFRLPFFHTMWASYFLSSSRSYFAKRGGEGGGYVRLAVLDESAIPGGRPAALLVGRPWSESFDANSPRILGGREFVLLREANRITELQGVYPTTGYPEHASLHFSLEITPHSESWLRLTLEPYIKKHWSEATWRIVHRAGAGTEAVQEVSGPPPWQIAVKLMPGSKQTVECQVISTPDTSTPWPFAIRQVTVESVP